MGGAASATGSNSDGEGDFLQVRPSDKGVQAHFNPGTAALHYQQQTDTESIRRADDGVTKGNLAGSAWSSYVPVYLFFPGRIDSLQNKQLQPRVGHAAAPLEIDEDRGEHEFVKL